MAEQDDFEKVQGFIKEQTEMYFKEAYAKAQTEQQKQQTETKSAVQQQDDVQKQAKSFVKELISDDLNSANFKSDNTMDFTKFYMNNPLAQEYMQEVEQAFESSVKAGRPIERAALLDYIRGKEMRTDPDNFQKKETARTKAQKDRAEQATDFGAGLLNRAKEDGTFSRFEDLSIPEMEKALEGITF